MSPLLDKSELAVQEPPAEKPLVPVANVTELVDAMKRFEEIKRGMLTDNDKYDPDGKGDRIKKSGWRKLALAFNISDEIVTENVTHDSADPAYLCVHTRVKAWARGGRTVEGVAAASSRERGFAHLEHDLHALAHTRAKSRAIADMLGSSDKIAEELEEPEQPAPKAPTPTPAGAADQRTRDPIVGRVKDAGALWDFLDEVLGKELADQISVDASGDDILVKLDKLHLEKYGNAFLSRMMKWGYGIHETPAGMVSMIKRPKGTH